MKVSEQMLAGSTATAPVRQRTQASSVRHKQGAEFLELRLIARQHQVCYEICPLYATSAGVRMQKGFELMLCGVNDHVSREGVLHAVPCCEHCAQTYCELRKIAEWVLHMKPPTRYEIYSFDSALHLAPPHRNHRSEIVITTAIFQHSEPKARDRRCEGECLKEVRARLSKLGIREDVLVAQPAANA